MRRRMCLGPVPGNFRRGGRPMWIPVPDAFDTRPVFGPFMHTDSDSWCRGCEVKCEFKDGTMSVSGSISATEEGDLKGTKSTTSWLESFKMPENTNIETIKAEFTEDGIQIWGELRKDERTGTSIPITTKKRT